LSRGGFRIPDRSGSITAFPLLNPAFSVIKCDEPFLIRVPDNRNRPSNKSPSISLRFSLLFPGRSVTLCILILCDVTAYNSFGNYL
jgi:hypothetical protein